MGRRGGEYALQLQTGNLQAPTLTLRFLEFATFIIFSLKFHKMPHIQVNYKKLGANGKLPLQCTL